MIRKLTFILSLLAAAIQLPAQPAAIRDLQPTVILISMDGFRYDYLDKYHPENILSLAKKGVRADWMTPSYPSLTFPNHYTIATGLYPSHHGIVANNMYDPEFGASFSLSKREEVQNGRWWGGEPIWVTAEKQGQIAGCFFFPGTEAEIQGVRPTFWKVYDGNIAFEDRVDQILAWLDLPQAQRPTFYTLYFEEPDHSGHTFGPDAPETARAVARVDEMIGRLTAGLKERGIFKQVNLILVSDHGMAPVKPENNVFLDDAFPLDLAAQISWGSSIVTIFPKLGEADHIWASAQAHPLQHARIYRQEDLPEHFHYTGHRRIPPFIAVAEPGWRLTSKPFYEDQKARQQGPMPAMTGVHGYDNEYPDMRAAFVAHGPAFRKHYKAPAFSNVEVYNLMTHILGLTPAPNDESSAHKGRGCCSV
ncbi:MAG TPA: ectonucleotide pyrophosphatase/phosphodiesterase, partial [Flavilitoribacter sp.]|nr:ectonucleotide pyrophosphatase/phosphodiesterase [Flavilitoribacter sp.]